MPVSIRLIGERQCLYCILGNGKRLLHAPQDGRKDAHALTRSLGGRDESLSFGHISDRYWQLWPEASA